jgi:hypothetical protein
VVHSQSVPCATVGAASRGCDAGKRVNGCKRELVVDAGGLIILVLTTAPACGTATAPTGVDAHLRDALAMLPTTPAGSIPPGRPHHRLMTQAGKHHNAALWTIATVLVTRLAACWRAGQPYRLRDTDGSPILPEQGRAICAQRYTIPAATRAAASGRVLTARTGQAGKARSRQALHQPARLPSRYRPATSRQHHPSPT